MHTIALSKMSWTLLEHVALKYKRSIFVETGSNEGQCIDMVLRLGYEKVFSVELDPGLAQHCRERFEGEPRVVLFEGHSVLKLPLILSQLDSPACFWLDAHDDSGAVETELYDEVKLILHSGIGDNVILIDDLRIFGTGWGRNISIEGLTELARSFDPLMSFEIEPNSMAVGDVLAIYKEKSVKQGHREIPCLRLW